MSHVQESAAIGCSYVGLFPLIPHVLISDVFKGAFSLNKWGAKTPPPTIHVYAFSRAADPEAELTEVRERH